MQRHRSWTCPSVSRICRLRLSGLSLDQEVMVVTVVLCSYLVSHKVGIGCLFSVLIYFWFFRSPSGCKRPVYDFEGWWAILPLAPSLLTISADAPTTTDGVLDISTCWCLWRRGHWVSSRCRRICIETSLSIIAVRCRSPSVLVVLKLRSQHRLAKYFRLSPIVLNDSGRWRNTTLGPSCAWWSRLDERHVPQ